MTFSSFCGPGFCGWTIIWIAWIELDEIVTRLGALERKVAGVELDYAAIQQRLDNVDRRLDRIERRLDLVDGLTLPLG